jgi:hypothetical protein
VHATLNGVSYTGDSSHASSGNVDSFDTSNDEIDLNFMAIQLQMKLTQ